MNLILLLIAMNMFKEFVVKASLMFTIVIQSPCGEIMVQEFPDTVGIMLAHTVSVYVCVCAHACAHTGTHATFQNLLMYSNPGRVKELFFHLLRGFLRLQHRTTLKGLCLY